MAVQALSPRELARTQTLFRGFMGRTGTNHRTVGELLAIYRERCAQLKAGEDPDDDLRVSRFMRDMASGRWRDVLVMRIGEFDGKVHLIDGTHRGIAYLACLESGISSARLPALAVER
jgi:hypothetical protein